MSTDPVPPGTSPRLCEVKDCGRPEYKEYPTWHIPSSDLSQVFGSDLAYARLCIEHVKQWRYDRCELIGCDAIGVWLISTEPFPPRTLPVLFGIKPYPESYAEWQRYQTWVFVCEEHLRSLRTKHGRVLEYYTKRDGTTQVRVKEEFF